MGEGGGCGPKDSSESRPTTEAKPDEAALKRICAIISGDLHYARKNRALGAVLRGAASSSFLVRPQLNPYRKVARSPAICLESRACIDYSR